jgi:hypothetical protein
MNRQQKADPKIDKEIMEDINQTAKSNRKEEGPLEPYKQGDVDGLCGAYSIINSARLIVKKLTEDDCMALLDRIIHHVEQKKKISSIITGGLSVRDMEGVMKKVMPNEFGIKAVRPFRTKKKVTINVFWNEVSKFINGNNGRKAVIIAIENHVWDHWTVIESISEKQARLFDSSEIARIDRKRCTTGKRNRNRTYSLGVANTFFLSKEKSEPKKGDKQTGKEAMQMKKKDQYHEQTKADTPQGL